MQTTFIRLAHGSNEKSASNTYAMCCFSVEKFQNLRRQHREFVMFAHIPFALQVKFSLSVLCAKQSWCVSVAG